MTIAPVSVDISEHNKIYTDAYGRRLIIFRATFGAHYPDQHFLANANRALREYHTGNIDGAFCYGVWLQSATPAEHYKFFWQQFGNKVPEWLMGTMTDIEAWRGTNYANHSDHSKELNQLLTMNAHKLGSWSASWWYGNGGDINELYPHRDPRFLGIQAKYGPRISLDLKGAVAQQYSDGQSKWGVPKGYPISSEPFGNVDHNAFPGVKSFKELKTKIRPFVVVPPPVKPPVKPPVAGPYYHSDGMAASGLVIPDGTGAWFPDNDGKLRFHKYDPKVKHGVIQRTI